MIIQMAVKIKDNKIEDSFYSKDLLEVKRQFIRYITESDVEIEDGDHTWRLLEDGECDIPNGCVQLLTLTI